MLILTGHRTTLGKLDAVLEREFTRRRLPFQLADLRAGQRLQFGPLSIDSQGVYASDQQLLWEQVANITLEKDRYLAISRMGDPPETWQRFPARKIPNLSTLLALFQRIRSGQSEQEAGMQTLAASYGTVTTIVQTGRRVDPLPEGLAALAGEHQLGERRLDQDLGRSRFASWIAIIVLAIIETAGLAFTFFIGKSTLLPYSTINGIVAFIPLIEFVLIGLLITSAIIRAMVLQFQHIHTGTYTFERGMIFQRARKAPEIFRWEEVETVWRKPGYGANWRSWSAIQYQSVYSYVLQLRDGSKHIFTPLNINQQTLGKIIKEQVVPLQLPAAIAAYQDNQTITFGPVQVNQQGIAVGARLVPWNQVRSVTLQGTRLVIFDIARRKPWRKLDTKRVPNLFLLFALADYARAGSLTASES